MKRTIGLLFLIALVVGVMATAALAATPGDGVRDFVDAGDQVGAGYAWGFVDDDGDGVNDNYLDGNGDGVCDNFVDEDGDGVNDLRGTNAADRPGARASACDGDDFVDADGDGVCDNAGSGQMGGQRHGGNK
jgi:hypothetical protein